MTKAISIISFIVFIASGNISGQVCSTAFQHESDTTLGKVIFSNTSMDLNDHFYWDFGDGTSSNYINPVHYYYCSGDYLVRLYSYDELNVCSSVSQEWIHVYKYNQYGCYAKFSDTVFFDGSYWYYQLFDESENCNFSQSVFHLSDAGILINGAIQNNPQKVDGWGRCNFIGNNRYLSTNYLNLSEYIKSLPINFDTEINYFGCSANFEFSTYPEEPDRNGRYVTFKAMNQDLEFYEWTITGFGNPIHAYTSYTYMYFPFNGHFDKGLVSLIVEDLNGCRDTVSQQLLIRSNWQHSYEHVEQLSLKEHIEIYPNPAQDMIYINMNNLNLKNAFGQVFNLQGQLLKEVSIKSDLVDMQLKDLESGVYIIRVESESGIYSNRIMLD
jgi:hypothetical protein